MPNVFDELDRKTYYNWKPYARKNVDEKIFNEYKKETRKIEDKFQNDLFETFDVQDNPKRFKCFDIAWSHGHSMGYYEIAYFFQEIVELIK